MGKIHCPDCWHDVSDRAYMCPNCGRPLGGDLGKDDDSSNKRGSSCLSRLITLIVIGLIIFGIFQWLK